MTHSLIWLALLLVALVVALCAAVKAFDLEHVDFKASVWKLADLSLTVKSKPHRRPPAARPPPTKLRRDKAVANPAPDGTNSPP